MQPTFIENTDEQSFFPIASEINPISWGNECSFEENPVSTLTLNLSNQLNVLKPRMETEESVAHRLSKSELLSNARFISDIKDLFTIRHKTDFELIDQQDQKWGLWKAILRIWLAEKIICKKIISSSYFETFIILVIILNVGTLAAEDPNAENQDDILVLFERIFLYIYTTEAFLKIEGLGLWKPKETAYFREMWNILDFSIVLSGWLEILVQEGVNLSALRTLRLLRPLRSISSIEGLRVIFIALITSFGPILVFLLVLVFFLVIFAIGGVQLWMGVLKYECVEIDTGEILPESTCGEFECPMNYECVKTLENPNYGATNFDNILYSFLVVFECMTTEGWYSVMVLMERAFNWFSFLFFIPLVFIGAFLMLNLILAVIKSSFSKAMTEVNEQPKENECTEIIIKDNESDEENDEFVFFQLDEYKATSGRLNASLDSNMLMAERYDSGMKIRNKFPQKSATSVHKNLTIFNEKTIKSFVFEKTTYRYQYWLKRIVARELLKTCTLGAPNRSLLKLENTKDIHTMVVEVGNNEIGVFGSIEDVFPSTEQQKKFISSNKYEYIYVDDKDEIINKSFISSYSDKGNEYEIFQYLSRKFSVKDAFKQMMNLAQSYILEIKDEDRIANQIIGGYSGYEIEEECEKEHNKLIRELSYFKYRIWEVGFLGVVQKLKHPLYCLVTSNGFNSLMILCVILNTIVLSLDHYGIENEMETALSNLNLTFTVIFCAELALKLSGLGVLEYCRDIMNYLDASVVIISLVELIFLEGTSAVSALRTIRIFRTFRVIRVARLFRYLESMMNIIKAISKSLSKFAYLALLLLLLNIIFALLGMQIFGGKFDFEDGLPRTNFDSFYWACITVFEVLSMENWQIVLYDAVRSEPGPFSSLFLISWIFIGNFVLLNLFLAILLDSFSENHETEDEQENEEGQNTKSSPIFSTRIVEKRKEKEKKRISIIEEDQHLDSEEDLGARNNSKLYIASDSEEGSYRSFFIFKRESYIRKKCEKITRSENFEKFILLLIVLSSIKLVIDTYLMEEPSDTEIVLISNYLDIAFTCAFACEFLMKAVSLGFVLDKGTYLRDYWNELDFIIVVFSIIELSISEVNVSAIKVLRLLRTLRPLRFITQNVSMKIVVVALLESLVALFNVTIVVLIVWLMFSILGVSLFGGKFYQCENEELNTREDCEKYGFEWENADSNFDNVIEGMVTLFILSSLEGWPDVMYSAVDSTDIDKGPERNHSEFAALYFVVFVFIGSFFFLNLFIGVMFDTFNEAKNSETSANTYLLTKDHKLWVDIQGLLVKVKPKLDISHKPTHKIRAFFYTLSKHILFEIFIITCILLNTLLMAIAYDEASALYVEILELLNFIFTLIFIVEAIIKNIGLGPRAYFHSKWNRFDFFVVTASMVDLIVSQWLNQDISLLSMGPQLIRVIRVLRVSRLVRLFRVLKGIQDLMNVLAYSLGAILNVLSLLLLILFIYAVLGVFILYGLEKKGVIDEYTNFDNFGMAMLVLLRMSTGEEWNNIMYECADQVGSAVIIYFVSFVAITSFIMLNMFVMVILESYDDFENNPESAVEVFSLEEKTFNRAWAIFSKPSKGWRIHVRNLTSFLYELGENLGVGKNEEIDEVLKELSLMNIHIDFDGYVYYNDMLFAILKRKYTQRLVYCSNKPLWKKIIREEEIRVNKILFRIRKKLKENFYTPQELKIKEAQPVEYNFVFSMIYLKSVFKSWKNYTKRKLSKERDASASITPRFSDLEFPGENSFESLNSSFHSFI